jgi:ABC-type uncharacterized transport system substrate-binding protein
MRLRWVVLSGIFFLTGAIPLAAHPHSGIDIKMEPVTENGMLEGVRVEWVFDRLEYAREMLEDYDLDSDQVLDTTEVERLRVLAFENAKDFSYFLYLSLGNDLIETPPAKNFDAKLSTEHIYYSFYLPYRLDYEVSPQDRIKHITFSLKDPTGFFELRILEFRPVYLSGGSSDMVYITNERWEKFTFNHEVDYVGELLVRDIILFPGRR